jgi:hypothetical protein
VFDENLVEDRKRILAKRVNLKLQMSGSLVALVRRTSIRESYFIKFVQIALYWAFLAILFHWIEFYVELRAFLTWEAFVSKWAWGVVDG